MITAAPLRSRGLSHSTATTAVKVAVAIPAGTTAVKVESLSGDMYVGVGTSGTAPTQGTTNSVVVAGGSAEVWTLDFNFQVDDYIYVTPTGASCQYRLGFYG